MFLPVFFNSLTFIQMTNPMEMSFAKDAGRQCNEQVFGLWKTIGPRENPGKHEENMQTLHRKILGLKQGSNLLVVRQQC